MNRISGHVLLSALLAAKVGFGDGMAVLPPTFGSFEGWLDAAQIEGNTCFNDTIAQYASANLATYDFFSVISPYDDTDLGNICVIDEDGDEFLCFMEDIISFEGVSQICLNEFQSETVPIDLVVRCGDEPSRVFMKIPFCLASTCNPYDALVYFSLKVFPTKVPDDGCSLELRYSGTSGGLACYEDTLELYGVDGSLNDTGAPLTPLTGLFPLSVLDNQTFFDDEELCNNTETSVKCDLGNKLATVEAACEFVGYHQNMTVVGSLENGSVSLTLANVHLCLSPTCTEAVDVVYFEHLMESRLQAEVLIQFEAFKDSDVPPPSSISLCSMEIINQYSGIDLEPYAPLDIVDDLNEEQLSNICIYDIAMNATVCDMQSVIVFETVEAICTDVFLQDTSPIDLVLICELETVTVFTGIPFCIPQVCSPNYALADFNLSYLQNLKSKDGCSVSVQYSGTSGIGCVDDTIEFYGLDTISLEPLDTAAQDLTEYFPLTPFINGSFTDREDLCNQTEYSVDCDFGDWLSEVQNICISMGGSFITADVFGYIMNGTAVIDGGENITAPATDIFGPSLLIDGGENITAPATDFFGPFLLSYGKSVNVRNVHFCMSPTCVPEEGVIYFSEMLQALTEMDLHLTVPVPMLFEVDFDEVHYDEDSSDAQCVADTIHLYNETILAQYDLEKIIANITEDQEAQICSFDEQRNRTTCNIDNIVNYELVEQVCTDTVGSATIPVDVVKRCKGLQTKHYTKVPFCGAPTCNPDRVFVQFNTEYFNNHGYLDPFEAHEFDPESECQLEYRYAGTSGLECVDDTLELYGLDQYLNTTNATTSYLTEFFPFTIMMDSNFTINDALCSTTESGMVDCDLSVLLETVATICENASGSFITAAIFDFPGTHVVTNVPFCFSSMCVPNEGLAYLEIMSKALTGTNISIVSEYHDDSHKDSGQHEWWNDYSCIYQISIQYNETGLQPYNPFTAIEKIPEDQYPSLCVYDSLVDQTKCDMGSIINYEAAEQVCTDELSAATKPIDITVRCEQESVVVFGTMPLCIPSGCGIYDIFAQYNLHAFPENPLDSGCTVEMGLTGTSSMGCFDDTLELYGLDRDFNTTNSPSDLNGFFPLSFLKDDSVLADASVCTETENRIDCDLQGLLNGVEDICEVLSGDFVSIEMSAYVDEKNVTVRNANFCLSPTCSVPDEGIAYFEHVFSNQVEVDVKMSIVEEPQDTTCAQTLILYGINETLNLIDEGPTLLTDLFPLNIVENISIVDDPRICANSESVEQKSIDCDLKRPHGFLDGRFGAVQIICENAYGNYIEIDGLANMNGTEMSVRNVPFCLNSSCDPEDGVSHYNSLFANLAEANLIPNNLQMTLSGRDREICDEDVEADFFFRMKENDALERKCKWLRRRPAAFKQRICGKLRSPRGGAMPARFMCPATCCMCQEKTNNRFFFKKKMEGAIPTALSKNCRWLNRQSPERKARFCKRKSRMNGLSTASSACPSSCGLCPLNGR